MHTEFYHIIIYNNIMKVIIIIYSEQTLRVDVARGECDAHQF